MSRVFVKGISAQTSCEDLRSLFSKLCPVSEVYIPGPTETTLRRNFAIVTLEGGEEEVKKCVKSFNSSIWKGSKLHVELAKEWYKERIAKEKEEQLDYEYSLQLQSQAVLEPVVYPPLSKETIALRRIRLQELPVVISMKPSSKRVKPNPKQRKPVVPCGIKIVFDDDILNHDHLTSSDDDTDSGSDADNEMKVIGDSSTRDKSIDMKATGAPCDTAAPSEVVSIINKLNSGEMKAIGGGIRKGFGSITVPAVPIVTAPASKADVSASTASTTPGNKYTSTSKLRGDVSCCIEENELSIPAHLLDEEESGDDEPCITEEDLQPEALSRERQRALELFGNMQFGPEATTIKPLKAPKETKGKAVTADVAASKGGAAKAAEAAETLTKEAKKVNFVAENEVREIPQEEGAARQASTLSAEEQETLDILNELKANANKPHPSAVAPTSSAVNADHQDTQKQVQQDEKVQEAAKVNPEAEVETEDILAVKDGYANMNQLKNIFYREGGMWWGDDGTLSGAVAKGSAALDPLFLEAEKHGMDIRLQRKTPAFTLGLLGSGDGAASETPAEADKQMVFSFFGAEDSAMDVVDVPVNPFLTNTSAKAMVGAEVREEVSLVPVVPAAGAKASTVTLTAPENAATAPGAKVKTVEVVFTAAQLVSMAKMFARERTVDELTAEWREGRDRLVLDYKRKRKDMKRRTAAWSSNNTLTVAERAATLAGSGAEAKRTYNSGGGGGSVSGNGRNNAHYLKGRNRGSAGRKKARKA